MVSGDTIVTRQYWDETTNQIINIEMTIKDHLLYDYLRKIESRLAKR
jgi:hypothetical protein